MTQRHKGKHAHKADAKTTGIIKRAKRAPSPEFIFSGRFDALAEAEADEVRDGESVEVFIGASTVRDAFWTRSATTNAVVIAVVAKDVALMHARVSARCRQQAGKFKGRG